MRSSILLPLALSTLLAASIAQANNNQSQTKFDYSYVDIGYVNGDYDSYDVDGLSVRGSYAFHDQFFAQASIKSLNGESAADLDTKSIGLGYRMPLNAQTDFFATVNFVDHEFGRYDDSGLAVDAGVRFAATGNIELEASLVYESVTDDNEFGLTVAGLYEFNHAVSGGVKISAIGEYDAIELFARLHF